MESHNAILDYWLLFPSGMFLLPSPSSYLSVGRFISLLRIAQGGLQILMTQSLRNRQQTESCRSPQTLKTRRKPKPVTPPSRKFLFRVTYYAPCILSYKSHTSVCILFSNYLARAKGLNETNENDRLLFKRSSKQENWSTKTTLEDDKRRYLLSNSQQRKIFKRIAIIAERKLRENRNG